MILACHRGCGGGAAKKMERPRQVHGMAGLPARPFVLCKRNFKYWLQPPSGPRAWATCEINIVFLRPKVDKDIGDTHTHEASLLPDDGCIAKVSTFSEGRGHPRPKCMPKGWWWIHRTPVPTNNSVNKYKTVCLCPYKMLPNVKLVDCSSISKHLLIYSQSDKGEKYWIF